MFATDLLSMLWCPTCQNGPLTPVDTPDEDGVREEDGALRCRACEATYPIHFGFPVLFPEGTLDKPEWSLWSAHLEKFQARRKARLKEPDYVINRVAEKSQPQPSFARFTDITEGTVLDIGCGPGKFRFHFDAAKVRYVGLDPIALPEVCDFPFAQGLAEYIPFKDGSFTDIFVMAALDHFRHLDQFLHEARRVLVGGGRLHILQSVHEVRGPISTVKVLAHKVKDALEDRATSLSEDDDVPKHLAEFTKGSLVERLSAVFDVVASQTYSATWYAPDKVFVSLVPKASESMAGVARPSRRRESEEPAHPSASP